MRYEVRVPSAGESVTEAFIGKWKKQSGDVVKKGDTLVDLESQKATFELAAEASGRLTIVKKTTGERVGIGEIIATIEDAAGVTSAPSTSTATQQQLPQTPTTPSRNVEHLGPAARRALREGKNPPAPSPATPSLTPASSTFSFSVDTSRGERKEPATRIRKQIAANLVAAQHTAAILTTFNEIDMSAVVALRKKYKDKIEKKHGIKVGMVGLFALAAAQALKEHPTVNATFTGEDIIWRDFVDLSIAVSTERGLVVPVIRDVQKLNWIGFEKILADTAEKARTGKLSIPEMTGGTFTITNGGVFGSLLATPLLNMPQSAILGLHKIEDRPVAINGKVEVRPMMYVALSYDHRLLDGKESVQFLARIKALMENPSSWINEKDLA